MKKLILRVECPRCNYIFETSTLKVVRCWNCDHRFKVLYYDRSLKTFRTRIVGIVSGNINTLHSKVNDVIGSVEWSLGKKPKNSLVGVK